MAIDRLDADPPDIILADVDMPKRDGYEVAAYVKSRPKLAHIPVVLLTGAFEPIDQARATAAGSSDVLAKPFEPQMVINRVKELLGKKRHGGGCVCLARGERCRMSRSRQMGDPQPPGREPAGDDNQSVSLDDYFDQLDAAFSNLQPGAPPIETARTRWTGSVADRRQPKQPSNPCRFTPSPPVRREQACAACANASAACAASPRRRAAAAAAATPVASVARSPLSLRRTGRPHRTRRRIALGRTCRTHRPIAPTHLSRPYAPYRTCRTQRTYRHRCTRPKPASIRSRTCRPRKPKPPRVPRRPVITDEVIEEIVSRVLQRMSDHVVRETVTDIVSQTAERLVQEEIERIRTGS